jgi:hypothetical protein
VFPAEQILVLIYEDYRDSNIATMRQVFEFIGVDPGFAVEPTTANPSGVRSLRLAGVWASTRDSVNPAYRALRSGAKAMMSRRMRDRMRRSYHRLNTASPPQVDVGLMAELRTQFAPEVRRLSDYMGRDLCSHWGYSSE